MIDFFRDGNLVSDCVFVMDSLFATVAQLVEQLIRNQQVAGSNPASSSTKTV